MKTTLVWFEISVLLFRLLPEDGTPAKVGIQLKPENSNRVQYAGQY